MKFAVVQQKLEMPEMERLKRAFRAVPGLTPFDAGVLGNDAFGILVKDQSAEAAAIMQGALRSEGIETFIVPESELPELPATKFLQRVECLPDGLRVYDSLGRDFVVPWIHMTLIAAGSVKTQKFERVRTEKKVRKYGPDGNTHEVIEVDYNSKERNEPQLQIELILGKNVARYTITADKSAPLLFSYLDERRTDNLPQNFALLVRDLIQFAPHAMLTRGCLQLRDGRDEVMSYPSKNAFFEEIVWFLWQWPEARRRQS